MLINTGVHFLIVFSFLCYFNELFLFRFTSILILNAMALIIVNNVFFFVVFFKILIVTKMRR